MTMWVESYCKEVLDVYSPANFLKSPAHLLCICHPKWGHISRNVPISGDSISVDLSYAG